MGWKQAYERADELTAADQPLRESWEYHGVRGILAVALAALGESVATDTLVRHLDQGPAHVRQLAVALVGEHLASGTDIDPAAVDMDDPQMATWVWLTRTWPADGPWEMPRGTARGRSDPALDILTAWAALAAQRSGSGRSTATSDLVDEHEQPAAPVGFPARYPSVWSACTVWAQALMLWHHETHPEVWLTANASHDDTQAVEALLTAALVDTACRRGLAAEADGSQIHLTPLTPLCDVLGIPYRWERVVEMLARLAGQFSPAQNLLEAVQLPGPPGEDDEAYRKLLKLTEAVVLANAKAAPLPAETTMKQLTAGDVPRLVDQAPALAQAARRRHDTDRAMNGPDDSPSGNA
ncbi:hypothetical protein ACIRPT_21155 [Streptomyces sp. NPDC101227]|uniref:hypothetical protein n=1 Tax=Streptomyces sp. NPDC101227 TaxID=3366136 RepID=UPI0038005DEE